MNGLENQSWLRQLPLPWKQLRAARASARKLRERPMAFLHILSATGEPGFAIRSSFPALGESGSDEEHLREAIHWLCRAQDVCQGNGFSIKFDTRTGWDVDPYPETTGYIIETLLDYYRHTGNRDLLARAIQAGDWEISIQSPNGGVVSNVHDPRKLRVFNAGQVMHGWVRLYEETREERFLQAAVRGAEYMLAIQEPNGSWIQDSHSGARTYYSRATWALLRVAAITGREDFAKAGFRQLNWVLQQQQPNGWFQNCGFENKDPITHVIGYTLRGLLEAHKLIRGGRLADPGMDYLGAVVRCADPLIERIRKFPALGIPGMPHMSYRSDWTSTDRTSCLTGNVQIAGVFFRLSSLTGNATYAETANQILDTMKRTQSIASTVDGVRGALPGSYPFFDGYLSFSFPNWATKFMADALLYRILQRDIQDEAASGGTVGGAHVYRTQ